MEKYRGPKYLTLFLLRSLALHLLHRLGKNPNIYYQQLLILLSVQIWLINTSFTRIMYSFNHLVFLGREFKFKSPVIFIRFPRHVLYFLHTSNWALDILFVHLGARLEGLHERSKTLFSFLLNSTLFPQAKMSRTKSKCAR